MNTCIFLFYARSPSSSYYFFFFFFHTPQLTQSPPPPFSCLHSSFTVLPSLPLLFLLRPSPLFPLSSFSVSLTIYCTRKTKTSLLLLSLLLVPKQSPSNQPPHPLAISIRRGCSEYGRPTHVMLHSSGDRHIRTDIHREGPMQLMAAALPLPLLLLMLLASARTDFWDGRKQQRALKTVTVVVFVRTYLQWRPFLEEACFGFLPTDKKHSGRSLARSPI